MTRPADRRFAIGRFSVSRFTAGLALITLLALAWRVAYVLLNVHRLRLNGDAAYYHWQANDIAHGHWFIDPTQWRLFGRETPSAGHPPAYLLYLAAVSKFIGTSETTHRLASTLLGAGAVFMLGVLARRIFASDWAGWIAAILAGAYAHLWINDEMLMSESMYVLTTAIAVWCAYRFWDKPSVRTAALMGAAIALAALSRAEALVLFPLLAVPFALLRRERSWPDRLRLAFVACAIGGVVLAPWLLYNATRFDHPVTMSNGIGSVLMVANCDYTDPQTGEFISTYKGTYAGYWSISCAYDLDQKLDEFSSPARAKQLKEQLGLIPGTDFAWFGDESTHEVAWRAVGLGEIDRHSKQMPEVVTLRVLRMWDFYRPAQNIDPFNAWVEGRGLWQSRLATFEYFPLLGLSIGGLVILRRRRVPILPFLAIAASITITAAATFGITRYRAPVDAMLPVLASGSIVWLARRPRPHRAPVDPSTNAPTPPSPPEPVATVA
jgi:4-amino-4-deoxy-L-arabinose transferase-like glycosyltransferase